jgi:hypothetical protein
LLLFLPKFFRARLNGLLFGGLNLEDGLTSRGLLTGDRPAKGDNGLLPYAIADFSGTSSREFRTARGIEGELRESEKLTKVGLACPGEKRKCGSRTAGTEGLGTRMESMLPFVDWVYVV